MTQDEISILRQASTTEGVSTKFCLPGSLADLEGRGLIRRPGMAPAWFLTRRGREYLAKSDAASEGA